MSGGEISSLIEGEFSTLVMGVEVVSFSDEVGSLSTTFVSFVPVKFTE